MMLIPALQLTASLHLKISYIYCFEDDPFLSGVSAYVGRDVLLSGVGSSSDPRSTIERWTRGMGLEIPMENRTTWIWVFPKKRVLQNG